MIYNADQRLKCGEREKIMTTINTTNNTKNAVEIRTELAKNGTIIEYIVVNGQKLGILGSTGEKDKQNAIRAIQTALDASNGNIYEMMQKLSTVATIEENEIDADEMITIDGVQYIVSYNNAAAYTTDGEEIVNCRDIPPMPREGIKAVLEARINVVNAERRNHDDEYDYDDEDDYEW